MGIKYLLLFLSAVSLYGQQPDSLRVNTTDIIATTVADTVVMNLQADSLSFKNVAQGKKHLINPWSLAIPAALILRGATSINSHFDHKLQRYFSETVKEKLRIDDHLQYMPIASVFALPNLGLPARHNLRERIVLASTAYAFTAVMVNATKYTVRQLRPDGSTHNSFPSGHTATVFTGVEILYQEYKDSDPWVGISGYLVATSVGLLRIYNNRHWASDVVAGAGIGILSTKLSYLLFPYTSKLLKRSKAPKNLSLSPSLLSDPFAYATLSIMPTYDAPYNNIGLSLNIAF